MWLLYPDKGFRYCGPFVESALMTADYIPRRLECRLCSFNVILPDNVINLTNNVINICF